MNAETSRIANAVDHVVGEMLDSYMIVGFVIGSGDAVVVGRIPDIKSQLAVQSMMVSVVGMGLGNGRTGERDEGSEG